MGLDNRNDIYVSLDHNINAAGKPGSSFSIFLHFSISECILSAGIFAATINKFTMSNG